MFNLLIADDEEDIRLGLSNYFPWNDLGFNIVKAVDNGKTALDYIYSDSVDVVLTDINMPIMNGIDLAKEISLYDKNIIVIFLSGYKDFEYAKQAIKYGVKDYVTKPTNYYEIQELFLSLKDKLQAKVISSSNIVKTPIETIKTPNKSPNEKQIISFMKDYINNNYKDVTLEDISKTVYMNPYYLSKLFKKETGINFSDYLMEIRMKIARELLKDVAYKTYEVGEMVGYIYPKNFTRAFKKYYGKSPNEYRNSIGD